MTIFGGVVDRRHGKGVASVLITRIVARIIRCVSRRTGGIRGAMRGGLARRIGGYCRVACGHWRAGRLFGHFPWLLVVTNTGNRGGAHIHLHGVSAPFTLMDVGCLFVAPCLIFFNDQILFQFQLIHIFNAGGHGTVGFFDGRDTAYFSTAFVTAAFCQGP